MTTITLELDKDDYMAITKAMAQRERNAPLGDHKSNLEGAALAEICRGWMEFMGFDYSDDGEGWKNA